MFVKFDIIQATAFITVQVPTALEMLFRRFECSVLLGISFN